MTRRSYLRGAHRMMVKARDLLRCKLPPKIYEQVDLLWWTGRHSLPRRVASYCLKRNPKVLGLAGSGASELVDQICRINLVPLTTMCHTMLRNGSDKGWGLHNYTRVYSALFNNLRAGPLRLFELGLGSNNPDMPFYMGVNGIPGASLRGWRELLPQAQIYGADIDRGILFEEDRIQTFFCDQLDESAIQDLWQEPALHGGVDVIIDDGHHTFKANTMFLDGSLRQLLPGGIYVVEDIHKDSLENWKVLLKTSYPAQFADYDFVLVELPHPLNRDDNNLLVVRRHL